MDENDSAAEGQLRIAEESDDAGREAVAQFPCGFLDLLFDL